MRIAILGTGSVGQAIATGLAGRGHQITFGTRDPDAAAEMAQRLGAGAASPAKAAESAEIVLLALPWRVAEAALKGMDLAGKVVIDCMNPIGMVNGRLDLLVGHTSSGAEVVAGWLPGARVVKTLNQVGAEVMARAATLPQRPVMFLAGDDPSAKAQVAQLLDELGFAPEDAGDLSRARLLEPLGMVWINQSMLRGKGRAWAFAALPA